MTDINIDEIETNPQEEMIEDVDGEQVSKDDALREFKIFVLNMNVAAYEEAVLRFGMSKSDAKALCIPSKLGKEFGFKCYTPVAPEEVTEEEASEVNGESFDE